MTTRVREEAQFESHWPKLVGTVKKQWPKIPPEQFQKIKGNRQELIRVIARTYHISRSAADQRLHMWINDPRQ